MTIKTNAEEISKKTRRNWWMDAGLLVAAAAAILSGIYFLFFPSGFQGGRNPLYNTVILFDRHTWDEIHTWSGILITIMVLVHLALHAEWIASVSRHIIGHIQGQRPPLKAQVKRNLILNVIEAISFFLTAISGVYFLFVPSGRSSIDPVFLYSRYTWDMIHTWAGIVFTITVILHFAIHWRWIVKVTRKIFHQAEEAVSIPTATIQKSI
jgi:cytochrome b subunit of formate dehydrogenase